jgi:hypothetical protein
MKEDVRQKRSHEEKCGRARVLDSDDAGFMSATEVTGHDLQPAARWAVIVARVERDDERGVRLLVHAEHEVLADRRLRKRHPLLRHPAQDDAGVDRGVDVLEVADAGGELNVAVHRSVEQGLFRFEMAEDGSRGHVELRRDVGKRRRRETLLGEYVARRLEDLFPVDSWRPAHL